MPFLPLSRCTFGDYDHSIFARFHMDMFGPHCLFLPIYLCADTWLLFSMRAYIPMNRVLVVHSSVHAMEWICLVRVKKHWYFLTRESAIFYNSPCDNLFYFSLVCVPQTAFGASKLHFTSQRIYFFDVLQFLVIRTCKVFFSVSLYLSHSHVYSVC